MSAWMGVVEAGVQGSTTQNERRLTDPLFSFQTLFHVINRHTGKQMSTRFYGDAMVVFHHINAYEDSGHLVFDLISYKDSSLYDMFYIKNITQDINHFVESNKKTFPPPVCQRFVLPLDVDKVEFR